MPDILMPRLSDSMEEGTILSWLKAEGEEVALGEELVEIETDKANMAYEADVAGTLTEILAPEGETLPIGAPIARVGGAEEAEEERGGDAAEDQAPRPAGPAAAGDPPSPAPAEAPSRTAPPAAAGDGAGEGRERVKASPLARRLARERGVELSSLSGSGPGGRIVKADVEGAGEAAAPARQAGAAGPAAAAPARGDEEGVKGHVTVAEPTKLQQTIARRMAESKATAPHFYLTTEVEMTKAVEAREALKAQAGEGEVVPSVNDMVLKACALALKEHPKANAAYRDGRFELYSRVNVGVAVAAPGALLVVTIPDADRKGLAQIATETRELAARVREQTITPPQLSGATFTVSNLGMHGITSFEAVINLPQAAILAVGAIRRLPRFDRAGELYPAQIMAATLSCDHRILYGAEGADLLARVRELLEEPLSLAL